MTNRNLVDVARRWIRALEESDFAAWSDIVADDLQIVTPFAPRGFEQSHTGRAACESAVRQYRALLKNLRFFDVELHATDDPNLVVGTGRSEGSTASGHAYANKYCWIVRFRDDKLCRFTEYFNPVPVIEALEAEQLAK